MTEESSNIPPKKPQLSEKKPSDNDAVCSQNHPKESSQAQNKTEEPLMRSLDFERCDDIVKKMKDLANTPDEIVQHLGPLERAFIEALREYLKKTKIE